MKSALAIALAAILLPSVAFAQSTDDEQQQSTPPVVIVNPPADPPPAPPPPQETTVVIPERETSYTTTSVNTPMIMGGAVLFLGSYGASVAVASNNDHNGADRLYVPLVGPWLALNDWGSCDDIENSACDDTTTAKVLLIGDGVAQALGVLAFTGGILSPRHHTVDTSTAGIHVAPTHNGAVVFGRF
jgi:hypothetical protein